MVSDVSLFPLQIQNIQLEREMALASNRSLAEQNLDMKPRLASQKEVLVERYSQLEAVRETYRQHCSLRGRREGWRLLKQWLRSCKLLRSLEADRGNVTTNKMFFLQSARNTGKSSSYWSVWGSLILLLSEIHRTIVPTCVQTIRLTNEPSDDQCGSCWTNVIC